MSTVLGSLGFIAGQNMFLAYFIVYIATIFLGNISAFAAFWVAFHGILGFWGIPFLVITIFAANVSGDLLWYSLGRALRNTRFGSFVKNHLPRHEKIERAIQKNGINWMIIAKVLYASSFPIVFSVGWARIKFKRFVKTSLLSVIIWLPILSGLAYGLFSGLSPLRAVSVFKRFEVVLIIGLVLFVIADYFVAKLLRKILGGKFGLLNGTENGGRSDNGQDSEGKPKTNQEIITRT